MSKVGLFLRGGGACRRQIPLLCRPTHPFRCGPGMPREHTLYAMIVLTSFGFGPEPRK